MTPQVRPEFSRPLAVERLAGAPQERRIAANAAERAALAVRLGLLELERLEARLRVRGTGPGRRVRIDGELEAEAVQACVVSLEPVRSRIAESFTQVYLLDPSEPEARAVAVTPESEADDPEPLGPGGLDLGEAVAQQLALALDPYPRAPGAGLPAGPNSPAAASPPGPRPFDALRALKRR